MAIKLNYSIALQQAQHAATTAAVGAGGKLYLFSGTQPADTEGADLRTPVFVCHNKS